MKGKNRVYVRQEFTNFSLLLNTKKNDGEIDQNALIKMFYCSSS